MERGDRQTVAEEMGAVTYSAYSRLGSLKGIRLNILPFVSHLNQILCEEDFSSQSVSHNKETRR